MISTLIYLIIAILILGFAWWVITLIPLPPPLPMVVQVLIVLIGFIIVIYFLLQFAGHDVGLSNGSGLRPLR